MPHRILHRAMLLCCCTALGGAMLLGSSRSALAIDHPFTQAEAQSAIGALRKMVAEALLEKNAANAKVQAAQANLTALAVHRGATPDAITAGVAAGRGSPDELVGVQQYQSAKATAAQVSARLSQDQSMLADTTNASQHLDVLNQIEGGLQQANHSLRTDAPTTQLAATALVPIPTTTPGALPSPDVFVDAKGLKASLVAMDPTIQDAIDHPSAVANLAFSKTWGDKTLFALDAGLGFTTNTTTSSTSIGETATLDAYYFTTGPHTILTANAALTSKVPSTSISGTISVSIAGQTPIVKSYPLGSAPSGKDDGSLNAPFSLTPVDWTFAPPLNIIGNALGVNLKVGVAGSAVLHYQYATDPSGAIAFLADPQVTATASPTLTISAVLVTGSAQGSIDLMTGDVVGGAVGTLVFPAEKSGAIGALDRAAVNVNGKTLDGTIQVSATVHCGFLCGGNKTYQFNVASWPGISGPIYQADSNWNFTAITPSAPGN